MYIKGEAIIRNGEKKNSEKIITHKKTNLSTS